MPRKGGSTETRTIDTGIKQQSTILLPVRNSLQIQFSFSSEIGVYHILSAELYSQDWYRAGYQIVFNFLIADEPSKVKQRTKFSFLLIVTRKLFKLH